MSVLVGNAEDRYFRDAVHFIVNLSSPVLSFYDVSVTRNEGMEINVLYVPNSVTIPILDAFCIKLHLNDSTLKL